MIASFRVFRFSFLVVFVIAGVSSSAQRAPRATVYEGARLIDGNGGRAIETAAFVVTDGRFTQVDRKEALHPPSDAAHVNLEGKTVMPALVDAHAHLGYRKGTTFTADNFTGENIQDQLGQLAYWGVSGVLSTGTDIGDLIFRMRSATNSKIWGGTFIRTAWRGIALPDGGPRPPMSVAPFAVRTAAEARADVRELADRKADFVKIWVDDRNGTAPKLTPDIYTAVIDEAHEHGMRVIAHVVTLADVKALLRADIDGFAHLFRDHDADEELMALLKKRPKVFFMLTLWAPRLASMTGPPAWLDEQRLRDWAAADELQQFRAGFANRTAQSVAPAVEEWKTLQKNVAALGKAGVRLILGTDVGGNTGGPLLGWTEHIELENMVAAGMTSAEAITASTKGSAEALRLSQLGTIERGKRADFLVLDGDPLVDITNSRKISAVYQRGVRVRPSP